MEIGFRRQFTMLIILAFATSLSFAESNVELCNGCSSATMQGKANSWAKRNINTAGVKKLYHAIDLQNKVFETYEVELRQVLLPSPQGFALAPYSRRIPTPHEVSTKIQDLFGQSKSLKMAAESVVIPKEIVKDAWEFVNCAYCRSRVESFIRQQATVESTVLSLESVMRSLGILSAEMPNTYRIPLESGGELLIKLTIQQDVNLTVEVLRATDIDGNDVPFSAPLLNGLSVYIGSTDRPVVIDFFILPLGYDVPNQTGRVIIKDCTAPPDPKC